MHLKTETQDTLKTRQGESKQVESKTSKFRTGNIGMNGTIIRLRQTVLTLKRTFEI